MLVIQSHGRPGHAVKFVTL